VEGDIATVGIDNYAAHHLGEIVFVELPEVDTEFARLDVASAVESVKAASDVINPVTGVVTEVNEALAATPDLCSSAPMGDGWIYKIKVQEVSELDDLLTAPLDHE
jgi:glycine cleavage system H protein